jgi:hypothetical protein
MKLIISGVSLATINTLDVDSIAEIITSALRDSKTQITKENCRNLGIFLGTTFNNVTIRKDNTERYRKSGVRVVNPADFPKGLISYLGGQLSTRFKIQGVNSTLSSGISSGIDAFAEGVYFVKRDKKNKAVIVELDEAISNNLTFSFKGGVCLIVEQGTNSIRQKKYAEVLGVEACFEKEDRSNGLLKAIEKSLSEYALGTSSINYVFSPGLANTTEHILTKEVLKKIANTPKENILFHCSRKDNNLSGLFLVAKALRDESFYRHGVKKSNTMFFLNLGKNTNSSCLAIKVR